MFPSLPLHVTIVLHLQSIQSIYESLLCYISLELLIFDLSASIVIIFH